MQLNSSGSGSMKEGEVLWIWLDRHKLGFLPLTSLVNLMGTSSCAFSHSRNGWWRFESRNNDDLEEAFMGGKQQVKLVIWILWELLDNLYQYLWPCLALYQTYHILKQGGDSDLWQHLCDQPGLYGTVSKVNASEEEKVLLTKVLQWKWKFIPPENLLLMTNNDKGSSETWRLPNARGWRALENPAGSKKVKIHIFKALW